jgi:hypothetical protein
MKLPWTTRKQTLASLRSAQTGIASNFDLPPIGDTQLRINISRNTSIALAVSLLLHALILFFVLPDFKTKTTLPKRSVMNITLMNPGPAKTVEAEPTPAPPVIKPKAAKAKPNKVIEKKVAAPKVMATPAPQTPQQNQTPIMPKAPDRQTDQPPATDMMALVQANRQRREGESKAYPEPSLPMEDARDAVIKKNLAQQGTNGIFQIKEMSLRSAQFTFRGWKSNYGSARLELIDVQAAPNESIEIAVVRKMIVVIRRDYSGDFHWLSPRYGDVIKSARIEDTAELEKFLMEEFFPNRSFR